MAVSNLLISSADFIRLLMTAKRRQATQLIKTSTQEQLKAVCELAYNLLTIELPRKTAKLIKKIKKIIVKCSKKTLSHKSKIRSILSVLFTLISIFISVKPIVLEIMST